MKRIVLDFETYYDKEYSLSKLTTEAYIRDPRFEVIGVSTKLKDEPAVWVTGTHEEIGAHLRSLPMDDALVIAHNTLFDGAILGWVFGIHPKMLGDTMGMARAWLGTERSASLRAVAEYYGLGAKGYEVENALGKHRTDFTPQSMRAYGQYCLQDVNLTEAAFRAMMDEGFPKRELRVIDMTLRMFTDPILSLDTSSLRNHLSNVVQAKQEMLDNIGVTDRSDLMSNNKFADMLRERGVEPPMKTSPTTGKETYAFAKSDQDFVALQESEDPEIAALVATRLGVKSTLEETRTQRFLDIASRGLFPIPLRYYGAHTGRWSGADKINLQNLPSRGPNGKKLKNCIVPPDGYMVVDCDASQIEARVLAWFAEQDDLVEAFANREDVYKKMASAIYGVEASEVTKPQRQVGKVAILGCFGADTEVLTSSGWKSIVCVLDTDLLWDGTEWVTHAGVIYQGRKPTITQYGVTATADHEMLVESGWVAWSEVCTNPHLFQSALRLASSLCSDTNQSPTVQAAHAGGTQYVDAAAGGKVRSTDKTSYEADQLGVTSARRLSQTKSGTGNTNTLVTMTRRARAYLIACRRALLGAITRTASSFTTTEGGELPCTGDGEQIGRRFSSTRSLSQGTTSPSWRWTELTSTEGMSRATFASSPDRLTCRTDGISEPCKNGSLRWKRRTPTYDIALAGPRNRFTIRTSEGPVIAHNCGYGVGGKKFKDVLKVMGGVDVTPEEAKEIVDLYRSTNENIKQLWWDAGRALEEMAKGRSRQIGREGVVEVDASERAIWLPSGLPILYPDLKVKRTDDSKEITYQGRGKKRNYIYGGKVVENLVQALARCIISDQMLLISKRYRAALTVHDSVVAVVPEAEIVDGTEFIMDCMRHLPAWAEGLPIDCEAAVGTSYGNTEEFSEWLKTQKGQ